MGWIAKAVAALGVGAAFMAAPAGAAQGGKADFGAQGASEDARFMSRSGRWNGGPRGHAVRRRGQEGGPAVRFRKRRPAVRRAPPALLGQATGDDSSPDVGEHTQAGEVPMHERTTPAGRFISQPGRNLKGEHVVWVDYAAAFAIHRLRPGRQPAVARGQPGFGHAGRQPGLAGLRRGPGGLLRERGAATAGPQPGVVYVLPETRQVREVFGSL